MKICIDARPVSEYMHGISRYAFNLIKYLAQMDTHHQYTILTRMNGHLFPPLSLNFKIHECHAPNYSVSEQFAIPWILRRESVDLFHSTSYSAPVLQPCKTIVTIHDLIPVIFPQYARLIHAAYYKHVVQRALQKAERILTVSHASKEDLVRYFGLDQNKIVVTYNGVDDRFKPDTSDHSKKIASEASGIKDPYILSVVNDKPYKNAGVIVQAFHKFSTGSKIPYKLVIVGTGQTAVLDRVLKTMVNRPIFLSKVTDDQLIALYQNAALFVLPTLYEGFCLPVLEAMACGTPVITSHVSSLPEVVGDAAILIDPNNIDELAGAIYNVLANKDLQKELREKGIRQAKKFSWSETAKQTLRVYEEVLSGT